MLNSLPDPRVLGTGDSPGPAHSVLGLGPDLLVVHPFRFLCEHRLMEKTRILQEGKMKRMDLLSQERGAEGGIILLA